jgi:hypothetical protein
MNSCKYTLSLFTLELRMLNVVSQLNGRKYYADMDEQCKLGNEYYIQCVKFLLK